jgi:hypothetical protein
MPTPIGSNNGSPDSADVESDKADEDDDDNDGACLGLDDVNDEEKEVLIGVKVLAGMVNAIT